MKKEHFKNLVLILLIITNFMLSQRIFANKKLWLFGYNFFANMGNNLKADDYLTAKHLTFPEKIFVNTGYQSSRFEFARGSEEFDKIYKGTEKIITSAFSSPIRNISEIDAGAWNSVLTGKSLYFSYSGDYSPALYAELLGAQQTNLALSSFSHLAISEDGNVYIKDNGADTYYRIHTTNNSVKTLIEDVMELYHDTESIINYSFELNFDKDFGDQKTFISPMVPVYSSPVNNRLFMAKNPLSRGDDLSENGIKRILSVFSINPNTVRRYTEADGSYVFVENNGILKISTKGVIAFTSNDTGIALSGGDNDAVSLSRFIDSVLSASGSQRELALTSSADKTHFTFDYLVSGTPVKFADTSAVSAVVENGYLKEYTHILREYVPTSYYEDIKSYIEALDDTIVYYQDSMKEIHIMEMYPAYMDNVSASEIKKDWFIAINDVVAE